MSVDKKIIDEAVKAQVLHPSPYEAHLGIVQSCREVLRAVAPFKQHELIKSLQALAASPGFTRYSFESALAYLDEGNAKGVTPSEYGLHALMSEQVKE